MTRTTTTPTTRSSHTKLNTPAIAGGIIGAAAAAILSVIGIVFFVRRRRRQGRHRSILSDSTANVSMTPFNPIPSGATLDRRTSIEQFPPSQAVAPVPPGSSGKEIAQLRARTLSSQPLNNPSALNVSQSTSSPNVVNDLPALDISQSTSSPNAVNESGQVTSMHDPQRLHSEVESLVRREMERLRAEVLVTVAPSGAPPSYAEEDGQ